MMREAPVSVPALATDLDAWFSGTPHCGKDVGGWDADSDQFSVAAQRPGCTCCGGIGEQSQTGEHSRCFICCFPLVTGDVASLSGV